MATQAELVTQLTNVGTQIDAMQAQITKVAGETGGLQTEVARLNALILAGGPITPELEAISASVATKFGVLAAGIQSLDDLVPDAPTP